VEIFSGHNKFSINIDKGNLTMFALVLIGLVVIFSYNVGAVAAAPGDTIYVNGSSGQDNWDGQIAVWNGTSGPKATIKNATGTINNGGTINIADGIYNGAQNTNITLSKSMNINGQSKDGTIINGTDTNWIFSILPGINITITNLTFSNGFVHYGEGAAINCSGNLTVNNCNFQYNNATDGGAIATYNGSFLTLNNSDFIGNINIYNCGAGGAICTEQYTISTIKDCTFINNGYVYEGGAIGNAGFLTIIDSKFVNNTASLGGAITNFYVDNATLNVYNSSFTGNNALVQGGAIFIDGCIGNIDSCDFTSNNATAGGAITNISTLIINNCKFNDNNATNYGGALVNGYILNVTNSAFTNNTATNGSIIYNHGVPNMNCATIMNFNKFIGNTATTGYDIYNYYGIFDATLNWWGSNTGPLTGTIYGNVTTTPWLVITANASPNGGLYNTNQIVNLNINVPGTIYYTLDGSDPTISSPIYVVPININISTVLKYLAVDLAGNESPVYTDNYTIDTEPPTACANYQTGYYNTTENVSLSMNEAGNIYYTLNGTTPTNTSTLYNGSIMVSKNTTLRYIAIDDASNVSSVYTQTYIIDKTIPTASVNVKSGLYNTNKVVTLTMSEPGNIYYTLNGTIPTNKSILYIKPITITSTMTLKYVAVDLAGNKSPVYTQTYTIDTIHPKVSATAPTNNYTHTSLSSPITIKFSEKIVAGVNYSKIYVKNITSGKTVAITKTITGNILTIKDHFNRINKDKYLVYLPAGAVKDLAGNVLANAYKFNFVTGPSVKAYSGHGVSFNYPVNWEVESYPQDGYELLLVSDMYSASQEAPSLQIEIVPNTAGISDQESFDSFVSSPNPPGYKIISKSTLTLNGNKAYENTYTINDKNIYNQIMEDQEIYLIKNHKLYILDFIAPYKTFSNEEGTFATLLNDFKIQ
jgi:hypothetical protein